MKRLLIMLLLLSLAVSAYAAKRITGGTPETPQDSDVFPFDRSGPDVARSATRADIIKPFYNSTGATRRALALKAPLDGTQPFTGPITAPGMNTTAPNGQRFVQPYNSIPFSGTPAEGMVQTTPSGLQIYHNGSWGAVSGSTADITDAQNQPYTNTVSGLIATTIKTAIDELHTYFTSRIDALIAAMRATGFLPPPAASFDKTTLAFGEIVPLESGSQSFRITNTGFRNLSTSRITGSGTGLTSFTGWSTCKNKTIAVNGYCDTTVTFTPDTAGSYSASLSIASNDPTSPHTVTMTGTGTGDFSDILLFWRAESATLAAGDYPVSAGAFSLISAANINPDNERIGTNGLDCPTAYDEARKTVTAGDLINTQTGRVGLWYRQNTAFVSGGYLFYYDADANNTIRIYTQSGGELTGYYKSGGTYSYYSISTAADMVADTWYFIEILWDTVSDTKSIKVNGTTVSTSTLTLEPIPTTGTMGFGNNIGTAVDSSLDNIIISSNVNRDLYGGGTGLCVATTSPR